MGLHLTRPTVSAGRYYPETYLDLIYALLPLAVSVHYRLLLLSFLGFFGGI